MSTSIERVRCIRANYALVQLPSGDWEASVSGHEWSDKRRIVGPDRTQVIAEFRVYWRHFHFPDEYKAFDAIFPYPFVQQI